MDSTITIGIIGGAGPMAGILLARKVIEICQRDYGCVDDADFPRLILLNVPFAEMLRPDSEAQDEATVSRQLAEGVRFLRSNGGVEAFAIACNTLHGFLGNSESECEHLISLIEEVEHYIAEREFSNVLVLGTSTSAVKSMYSGCWPATQEQMLVDQLIRSVLRGDTSAQARDQLKALVRRLVEQDPSNSIDGVLLGCSELSVLMDGAPSGFLGVEVVDPLEIVAGKLCDVVFNPQPSQGE